MLIAAPVALEPLAPSAELVAPAAPIQARCSLPAGFTPSSTDWVTLARIGNSDQEYGPWLYNKNADRSVALEFVAPERPGLYEFRYYPRNGFTILQRSQPFAVAAPAADAPLILGSCGAAERIQNGVALQAQVDAACAGDGLLELPHGHIYLDFTADRRSIRVWNALTIRSAGKTVLHMGPDNPSWTGPGWQLLTLEPGDYRFELGPDVDAEGPAFTPKLIVTDTYSGQDENSPAPAFLVSKGSRQPGLRRHIHVHGIKLVGDWRKRRAFQHGVHIDADVDTSSTSFVWTDSYVDTLGGALSAFGSGGELHTSRIHAITGDLYPDSPTGFGNVYYVHQGRPLYADNCHLVSRFGRDCVAWRGTRSEGAGKSGKLSDCVFGSARVDSLIALGRIPTEADKHWGVGVAFDKYMPEVPISNCYFEASLHTAINHWGGFNLDGGAIMCPYAFIGGGDQTGEKPLVTVTGTRMRGIRSVMYSVMEGAVWRFLGVAIESGSADVLFATAVREQQVFIDASIIRILNPNGEPFQQGPGAWEVRNTPVLRQ